MTVGEHRKVGNKHVGLDKYRLIYPQYCQYMLDLHAKYDNKPKNEFPMGADYGFYFEITEKIIKNKYKHIIEYGSGFTTMLLHHIKHSVDWDIQYTSYENVQPYIDLLISEGFDPDNSIKYVDYYYDNTKQEKVVNAEHDLDIHKDVDYIIIDGPDSNYLGVTTKEGAAINGMYGILSEHLNKEIDLSIDGRHYVRVYHNTYYNKGF